MTILFNYALNFTTTVYCSQIKLHTVSTATSDGPIQPKILNERLSNNMVDRIDQEIPAKHPFI